MGSVRALVVMFPFARLRLIYHQTTGSGKSVLAYVSRWISLKLFTDFDRSQIIDLMEPAYNEFSLAYFYCNYGEAGRRDPASILRSIVKQLCLQSPTGNRYWRSTTNDSKTVTRARWTSMRSIRWVSPNNDRDRRPGRM